MIPPSGVTWSGPSRPRRPVSPRITPGHGWRQRRCRLVGQPRAQCAQGGHRSRPAAPGHPPLRGSRPRRGRRRTAPAYSSRPHRRQRSLTAATSCADRCCTNGMNLPLWTAVLVRRWQGAACCAWQRLVQTLLYRAGWHTEDVFDRLFRHATTPRVRTCGTRLRVSNDCRTFAEGLPCLGGERRRRIHQSPPVSPSATTGLSDTTQDHRVERSSAVLTQ